MDGINVLSLFDGMSCGRIALERAGIKVDNYFASEIDKHAIKVTQHNYPNTKQLGDVTKVKVKSLRLSEIYSYICNYDNNLQSNISEWEVLYWLNKNFTFSAKIGTQKPNERQEVSESSIIQRIEEVWFSNREMGSVRKFGDDTRSGSNGKENDIRTPQQLQCSEWRYDNDIYRRYKEENIGIAIRETQNGDSEKKNFGNIKETFFKGKESENYFGEKEKSNVEEGCSGELLEREGEDRFSRTVKEEKRNGRAEKNSFIDEIVRELCGWNETDGIAQDYWNILRLHKEEQVTVVGYEGGYHIFQGKIDLCIGGSPCQSFSFAGKQKGMITKCNIEITTLEQYLDLKNKDFEFQGQSFLFWEYVRLLKEVKPTYFLLENVIMKKEWEDVITDTLGVKPIEITSAKFVPQARRRLYWTNIPNVEQPQQVEYNVQDFIDGEGFPTSSGIDRVFKKKTIFNTLTATYWKGIRGSSRPAVSVREGFLDTDREAHRMLTPTECERLQTVPIGYTDCVAKTNRYKMLGNGWTVEVIKHIFKNIK